MEKDVEGIRQEALKMSWFMRGGITYNEAMDMSVEERKIISEIIKENLEISKKSNMPFF